MGIIKFLTNRQINARQLLHGAVLVAAMLLIGASSHAQPITITWEGAFGSGVSFDGTDVSGLSWIVRQFGDTTFEDIDPDDEVGRFAGFSTEMDILGIIGLRGLTADNTSGIEFTATLISLINDPASNCFLCGQDSVVPFDPNTLGSFATIDVSNGFGAYFGFGSINGPLYSFDGGRSFDGDYRSQPMFSVSATTSVPEPGSLALLGIGLAGIAIARRRRVA